MKRILLSASLMIVITLTFGCSNNNNDEINQLKTQITELENEKIQEEEEREAEEERLAQDEEERKAEEERLAQEEEDRKIQDEEERKAEEEEGKQNKEDNIPKTLGPGISTGDPRKDEIDMFKRIVSENTGPACNIYGIAPCPEWPNFIKTNLVLTIFQFTKKQNVKVNLTIKNISLKHQKQII